MELTTATAASRQDETLSVLPLTAPEHALRLPSLLELASLVVAASVELEEIAFHYEYLPPSARQILLRRIKDTRLRHLERLMASNNAPPSFALTAAHECEFQNAWRRRCHMRSLPVDTPISSDTLFREPSKRHARDARRVFWEHHFRSVLRTAPASATAIVTPSGEFVDAVPCPDLTLYDDVVVALKVNARELVPRNVSWMLQLHKLQRIELHHPADHNREVVAHGLDSLLMVSPSLQELAVFHGRLSTSLLQRIAAAITKRQQQLKSSGLLLPIRAIEFVSVMLKSKHDHRALVEFFDHVANVPLERVRISSVVRDLENRRLVDALLTMPRLSHLSLEHNDLEDDAFTGVLHSARLGQHAKPVALRHVRLGSNSISSTTMQTLSSATLDGLIALETLELRNNQQLGDAGVHALAPLLTPGISRLTHLDISNCHVGLEGALTLLSALAANETLMSLDMSQNYFGSSIGDLLAELLLTNQTLRRLHVNYVGLGLSGCTERLLLALRTNQSLRVLSLGANRLRDQGAARVMAAIAVRSRVLAYEALDLSGNLITSDGLYELHRVLGTSPSNDDEEESNNEPSRKRRRMVHDLTAEEPLIGELGLLNNDILSSGDAAARTHAAINALKPFITTVHSNEWSSRRSVYDDEV